jgi:hypothetical protein
MSRLFTFGCSFTQYMWPTWADIIAYDLGIEYRNYAVAGLGNVGIQHRILEADIKHTFTDKDIILILWTGWCREDRVKNHQWIASGSVLNSNNKVYDRKFLKRYWDYSNDIVKNATAIISTNKIYKDNINWQGTGLPLFFTEGSRPDDTKEDTFLINLYKKRMPNIETVDTFKNDFDNLAFLGIDDCHPDVKDHLNIVKNHVYKKINLTLKTETEKRFLEFQTTVENQYKNKKVPIAMVANYIRTLLTTQFLDIHKIMNYRILLENG